MKKFEIIRSIFNIVMREGFFDDKEDSISEYTRDKLTNTVYVKKLNINLGKIESIAITSLEYDFSDCCDSDLRIAFNDTNIGKRVILYANEVEYSILREIFNYLKVEYSETIEEKNYNILIKDIDSQSISGPNVSVNLSALKFILFLVRTKILNKTN